MISSSTDSRSSIPYVGSGEEITEHGVEIGISILFDQYCVTYSTDPISSLYIRSL